jgi:hypothetical protein
VRSNRRGAESDERGTMSSGHDRISRQVETMMTADSLQLTAHGPGEDEMRIVEDPPKAKPLFRELVL